MCKRCEQRRMDRRSVLALLATGLGAAVAAPRDSVAAAAEGPRPRTPDEARAALEKGNARYVSDPQICTMDLAAARTGVAAKQQPWATIVGCADSRVPPELLFGGLGVGELFVARNAGNLVDTAVIGTVEYGAVVLGSPLIVVLGHSRCGAVAAACDVVLKNATFPGSIGTMIEPIVPAAIAARSQPGDFLNNAIRENAQRTAGRLAASSALLADLIKDEKLRIVAANYDLESGKVDFFA
jgi:carbonic anhydrase